MGFSFPTWDQRVRQAREQEGIAQKIIGLVDRREGFINAGKFKKSDKMGKKILKLFDKLD